jgi:putative hemolysin
VKLTILTALVRLPLTRNPPQARQKKKVEANMRLGSVILVIWLIIGLIATAQRGYLNDRVSCASAGTVIVTILAGPLNFVGVNPKLSRH